MGSHVVNPKQKPICVTVYGLKQAPPAWFKKFISVLLKSSYSTHIMILLYSLISSSHGKILLHLCADNMIITGGNLDSTAFLMDHPASYLK